MVTFLIKIPNTLKDTKEEEFKIKVNPMVQLHA